MSYNILAYRSLDFCKESIRQGRAVTRTGLSISHPDLTFLLVVLVSSSSFAWAIHAHHLEQLDALLAASEQTQLSYLEFLERVLSGPANRRESQVVAGILKRNLNIEVEVVTKDGPVVLEDYLKMDFDLARLGSGGDFDPDDAIVDWMQTDSKFNGLKRDKDKMAFGYFSDKRADELIDQQRLETDPVKRKAMVQEANRITSEKVACAFLFHLMSILVYRTSVDYPAVSRIPGLVELDRISLA